MTTHVPGAETAPEIDLYYWPTANGQKIAIFLEEAGLPYSAHPVDISKGEQFLPGFEQLSANQRIPAIFDRGANVSLFESGAILLYLAERTGQFLPRDAQGRAEAVQWLFWQAASQGPILGQTVFFRNFASEQVPFANARFGKETARLYAVLERRLMDRCYIAGEFSIADMAVYPWIIQHDKQGMTLDEYPNTQRWLDRISARPAVQRAYQKGEVIRPAALTEANRKALFGLTAGTAAG
ncbi:MAG: Glutathione S-transferase [Pseudomonas sp.]|nr:Glutathione S-transferase [Pseudomonas sp.]